MTTIRVSARLSELRCALCHEAAGELVKRCLGCGTVLHPGCAWAARSCPTLGCATSVKRARRVVLVPETIPHVAVTSLGVILAAFLVAATSFLRPELAHARPLDFDCTISWRRERRAPPALLDITPRSVLVDEGPVEETPDGEPISPRPEDDVIV